MISDNSSSTEVREKDKKHSVSFLTKKGLLVILSSNFFGQTYILNRNNNLIGRSDECSLVIEDQQISGRHCLISIDEFENFYIEDLGSSNFTYLNGRKLKKLKKRTKLFYGDKIVLGSTILRFYLEEKFSK